MLFDTEFDEYTDDGSLSDDEMLDDLSQILEDSERYFLKKTEKPARWGSTCSVESSVDSGLDEVPMTPMRTISTSFVRRCIPENEELTITPQFERKVVQIWNCSKASSCEF